MKSKEELSKQEMEYLLALTKESTKDELIESLMRDILATTDILIQHEIKEEFETCTAYREIIKTKVNDVKLALEIFYTPTDDDYQLLEEIAPTALLIIRERNLQNDHK